MLLIGDDLIRLSFHLVGYLFLEVILFEKIIAFWQTIF